MKKTSLISMFVVAMTLVPMGSYAQGQRMVDVTYLVLTGNDGMVSRFALSDSPAISFSGGNLVVACQGDELITPLGDLHDYTFVVEQQTTGIDNILTAEGSVASQQPAISFSDAKISGLKAGARISIYNMNGLLVDQIIADKQGEASFDLKNLSKGIYILRTPNKSFKIINR